MEILVAKSYQNLIKVGEVFTSSGKQYINIKTKTGSIKPVRVYSEKEYTRMYPEDKSDKSKDPYYKTQKYVLGFEKDYITVFKNTKPEQEEWFKESICRFARWWGWYVPSNKEIPKDLPSGVEPVRLYWKTVGGEDERIFSEQIIQKNINSILNSNQKIGDIGERIERTLTVLEATVEEIPRFHSKTITHLMVDDKNEFYIWKTSAKHWEVGTVKRVRGTIKEYKDNVVVLTRCMEV